MKTGTRFAALFFYVGLAASALDADEGYWLFSDAPVEAISAKYHFKPDAAWLKHLGGAAVKIGGGSGSFISQDGLVITNRHVGAGELHTLSTKAHNYERDGFYAPTLKDEMPCHGLEIFVLQHTEDVTARVNAAIHPDSTPGEAEEAHKAITAAIEKESFDRTGLTSEVVTLFGGAQYELYQYKKYPDVRVVFSPEEQIGFFGGDPDNFEFPRFDLDICLFRIYEHGKPLKTPDYLKWNAAGPTKDDLVFVAGHPGSSQRLVTMDEIDFQKNFRLPAAMEDLERLERLLTKFSASSPEHNQQASSAVASVANSRKATHGSLSGLRQPDLLKEKAADQAKFRELLARDPAQEAAEEAFAQVREAIKADKANFKAYQSYERFASRSDIFNMARTLVRAAAEKEKPNGQRLPAYRESSLPTLEFRLFSGRPFHPDLEILFLTDGLEYALKQFGESDPLVKKLFAGKTPRERATELVNATKIEEVGERKKLYSGGQEEITASHDPILEFAAVMDAAARTARKMDDDDDEIKRRAYAVIYKARVALNKAPSYPDATGTLRLAYGTVTGWREGDKEIGPFTDFAGLYVRSAEHGDNAPFKLPHSWVEAKDKLHPGTPFNFVTTADILGGNSGSPIVNKQGEFVGVIFDGNEASLAGRYIFNPANNRSVAVDSAAIIEALRTVYHAGPLADELESGVKR